MHNSSWLRNIVLLCIIILRDIFVVHRLLAPVSLADGEWVGEKGWLEIVCCNNFDVKCLKRIIAKRFLWLNGLYGKWLGRRLKFVLSPAIFCG